MKSIVEYFTPVDEIEIPHNYFHIEIPSWQTVLEPTLAVVAKEFSTDDSLNEPITDEMVQQLRLPGIHSLADLLKVTKHNYVVRLADRLFYERILPFILTYWQMSCEVVVNQEEWLSYKEQRMNYLETFAKDYEMSLETYCREVLKIKGNLNEALEEQAKEEFIFKLIAKKVYESQGYGYTLDDYEAYIQQQSLANQEDPIALQEALPFSVFEAQIAEIYLTQLLHDYFVPQFEIHTKNDHQIISLKDMIVKEL